MPGEESGNIFPLLDNPSTFERTLIWQNQFLKGVADGFNRQEWALVTRVFVKIARMIANLDLEKIENINEAYDKGYGLVQAIRKDIYKNGVDQIQVGHR